MKQIRLTESDLHRIVKETVDKILKENEGFTNNQGYSHFAVNKNTGKIVNGWDYNGYDPVDLRSDRKYYFINDLVDNELNPKDYKILTDKMLRKGGIDPDDNSNWANS